MLSKSAARAFFLGGTLLCSAVFLTLTVDTMGKLPERTHLDQLSDAVVRGKALWESNNCMGCHTIFGEGAYYAPDLTKVYAKRGPAFIKKQINDAQAMYPGERKMVDYDFSEAELDDLVAFFEWCGKVDLNGFPPKPTLGAAAAPLAAAAVSRPAVFDQICVACHSVGGAGGQVGPALDGVGSRFSREQLRTWLKNPAAVKPDSKMPQLPLTEEQLEAAVSYLSTLKGSAQ